MNEKNIKLASALTYAGAFPFVFLVLTLKCNLGTDDYQLALRAYAAVIIAFLCGIHWASFLFFSEQCPRNLLLHSNVIALIGWLSLLITYHALAYAIDIGCLIYLLALDRMLWTRNIMPTWFWLVRRNATCVVSFLLFIAIV